jgi:NADH-quinone oxidoreductase subunit M
VVFYYSGLFFIMPIWSVLFFISILANFGLPCTINFVGEFIVLLAIFNVNFLILIFLFIGLILTLGYSLFLYNRMVHGLITNKYIRYYNDVTRREFTLLINFSILIILLGLSPQILIKYIFTVNYYLFCIV